MKIKRLLPLLSVFLLWSGISLPAYGAEDEKALTAQYGEYKQRLDEVKTKKEIASKGFQIIKNQVFPVELEGVGKVSFIPAFDKTYHRLVLFFVKKSGEVVYKTDQLEANRQWPGKLSQPNGQVAAVSFQDMDEDGLTDIVLITTSVGETGRYAGRAYKVGDVLFQKDGAFYQDYRLSDKINRFDMNKSIKFITSFIRDGYSTEFLYTAGTQKELLDNGFKIMTDQCSRIQFEKLGTLFVVPGSYPMAESTVFMIYLVNEQGLIVWSFQPMGDFENLYALHGITCKDIDGDGLKDLVTLASYSCGDEGGENVIESDYSVYCQKTGGFYEDTDIKSAVTCADTDSLTELTDKLRAYWGLKSEQ